MARAQFYDVGIDSSGNAITSTEVSVFLAGTSTLANIYETEVGVTVKSNPFNASTGFIDFWAEPAEYDVKIEDTNSPISFTTRTVRWSSIPAVDGVLTDTIADDAVTYSKHAKDPLSLSGHGAFIGYTTRMVVTGLGSTTRLNTDGNSHPMTCASIDVNNNNAFNATTGYYTAPETGAYLISLNVGFTGSPRIPYISWRDSDSGVIPFTDDDVAFSTMNSGQNFISFNFVKTLSLGATCAWMFSTEGAGSFSFNNDIYGNFSILPIYRR